MKFRIVREYDRFVPQVWIESKYNFHGGDYVLIGKYPYYSTIEEAEKVCKDYKLMSDQPIVKEFEL